MRTNTVALIGILSVLSCMVGGADTGAVQRITAVSTQTTDSVDITTLSGVTYTNCTISRAEPDGITVFYANGIAKIPFTELPRELQTKYNYNPTNAAAYTRSVNQKQTEAWARQQ